MSQLRRYVGHIIALRPGCLSRQIRRAGALAGLRENRFLVGHAIRKRGLLVCYGADLCLLVSPAEVTLL